MSPLSLILGLVILVVVGYFVLAPVLGKAPAPAVESARAAARAHLEAERETVYAAIRELDLDRQAGEVAEAEYHVRREQLMARGVEILQALDTVTGAEPPPDL
ncbi:MAG: hypothetical protein JXB47_08560 [Anaerolineae bacterium]|nr:hypothetical protein [Anaerolineae bacterium]